MLPKQLRRFLHKQVLNLGIYGIGQAFNLITPLLVVPYIVGVCSEEGYGKIAIGMALSFFLMVFIDYGSDIIGVKQAAILRDEPEKLAALFAKTYAAKFVMLGLVLLVITILILALPYFSVESKLYFLGLPILLGQCLNPTWFLQGIENFKWITILTIISKTVYVIGVFALIHRPEDYVYNNLVWGLGMITGHLAALVFIFRKFPVSFSAVRREDIKVLIRDNFSIFSSQIFVSLQMYAPISLVGYFGGNILAGQYKIVDQVIVIFKTYLLLFFNFVYPTVCYLLEVSVREGLRFWKQYNGLNFAFIFVSMAVIFNWSTEVVTYFNPQGIEQISSLLRLAVFIPLAQAVAIPLRQLVLGWNRQKEYVRYTMFMTVVSLLAVVVAVPLLQVRGVLLALIFTEVATAALFANAVKRNFFSVG